MRALTIPGLVPTLANPSHTNSRKARLSNPPADLNHPAPPRSSTSSLAIMAAINKIAANSPSRQNPSELETAVAGALFDLESNTQDLKATLRPLQFVSAREVRIELF